VDVRTDTAAAQDGLTPQLIQRSHGGRYLHTEMARRIAFLRADPSPDQVSQLNARELEILRLLVAGYTIAQIGDALKVSDKTIANLHLSQAKAWCAYHHGTDAYRTRRKDGERSRTTTDIIPFSRSADLRSAILLD
jgi:DNA-binding NarL/FixJ family response regulator